MKTIFSELLKLRNWMTACILLVIFSCNKDVPEPDPVSYLNLYNAVPDSPQLDVYLNGTKVTNSSFDYAEFSGYLSFPIGTSVMSFNSYGTATKLLETNVVTERDKSYTMFLIVESDKLETWLLTDASSQVRLDSAKVRFVQLSPDADEVDIVVSGTNGATLFSGKPYKSATSFVNIKPDSYSLTIKRKSDGTELVTVPNLKIEAAKYYTLTARGFVNPPSGNSNKITLHLLMN